MTSKILNELQLRKELLHYMKDNQFVANDIYLAMNDKLECGLSLPEETLYSILCDELFNKIDEYTVFYDELTHTELLLSRAIVGNNPYKLEFMYTIEQRDKYNYLISSTDFEIGEESKVFKLLEDLGVSDYDVS